MITGDYVIEEHSDTVNWWAVALTLSVATGVAMMVFRRQRI